MESVRSSSNSIISLAEVDDILSEEYGEYGCFYCNEKDADKLKRCRLCKIVLHCSKDHQNIHLPSER